MVKKKKNEIDKISCTDIVSSIENSHASDNERLDIKSIYDMAQKMVPFDQIATIHGTTEAKIKTALRYYDAPGGVTVNQFKDMKEPALISAQARSLNIANQMLDRLQDDLNTGRPVKLENIKELKMLMEAFGKMHDMARQESGQSNDIDFPSIVRMVGTLKIENQCNVIDIKQEE